MAILQVDLGRNEMIPIKSVVTIFLVIMLTTWLGAESVARQSPKIQKERRTYVLGAIKELQSRADSVRRALEHMQAACQLVQQVPPGSATPSTSGFCQDGSMHTVRQEISSAFSALNEARREVKSNDFDRAEHHLGDALNEISRARDVLKI